MARGGRVDGLTLASVFVTSKSCAGLTRESWTKEGPTEALIYGRVNGLGLGPLAREGAASRMRRAHVGA